MLSKICILYNSKYLLLIFTLRLNQCMTVLMRIITCPTEFANS